MKNLKYLRESKGIKQCELANYLNITTPAYSRYETGSRKPDPKTLSLLADYFNVSVDYLIGRVDTKDNYKGLDLFKTKNITLDDIIDKFDININNEKLSKKEVELLVSVIKSFEDNR